LAGSLFAPHYARPLIRACGLIPAPLRAGPSDGAEMVSELLPGEEFAVLDITAGWAWGYGRADHRVGYVEAIELVEPLETSHVVVEPLAPIQPDASPLSPALSFLPMGSRLQGDVHGAMLSIEGGCIPLSYLRPLGEHDEDPVNVACRLLGAPFSPGGRTVHGVDSGGLVQLSLQLAGRPCPRDSDQQRLLGEPLPEEAPLKRGDLLFCDDRVAMMVDDQMAIQASAEAGKVTVEPFRCAVPAGAGSGLERRRLD
jgi:hypothetical protein